VNRELGTTTALITHNTPIASMADRVVSLADGHIASEVRPLLRVAPEELRW
jgi:putative ABC transport system ATP-binding protein